VQGTKVKFRSEKRQYERRTRTIFRIHSGGVRSLARAGVVLAVLRGSGAVQGLRLTLRKGSRASSRRYRRLAST